MSVVVFLCFFDLLGCSSKDSVSPVLVLKKNVLNVCEIKEFWSLSLQSAELYFTFTKIYDHDKRVGLKNS